MSFLFSEDAALKEKLKGIKVVDEKNATRDVEVWYANPDIELRKQTFPFITLELIDTSFAGYRQHAGITYDTDRQGTTPAQPGVVYGYELPVAYDLTYQVTTYSRHPIHDRVIHSYILTKVFPANRGVLAVPNDLGTFVGYRHMFLQEFTKRDAVDEGRRLYRNVYTVQVISEASPSLQLTTKEVASVLINETTTDIPADLRPV